MLGPGSWIIVGVVALLIFGPKKLPELGKAAGKTLREFKNATSGLVDDDNEQDKKEKDKDNEQDKKNKDQD
ncbi:twin-arginine translocase TatA/TatE family subunit [Pseudalkalibacillus berkeleyi]|uniref:Sec-independent protein translocase protein TatA n=1 Tax=Pseudalkalibacillus berkeleyi TaxID=1069813 RepID=A0ABS9H3L1_9BACL|nr:twin-arginine translocase TatA/TatE family subunit [Pseudalkalibacillus berkeleyi]MCF6139534.1 twin-arginine translocase TatA/TatE family subunit [Pseudalkalibacillus berkeleyi]